MKNYVKDGKANLLINEISHLVDKGLSDREISEDFNRNDIPNVTNDDGRWSPSDVESIRLDFNLDGSDHVVIQEIMVKSFWGNSADAHAKFRKDSEFMAKESYYPISQHWVPGSYGTGAFIIATLLTFILVGLLVFIYMALVKPPGRLTVTYEYRKQETKEVLINKICPKCAESIKRAAILCRFCGFSYEESDARELAKS